MIKKTQNQITQPLSMSPMKLLTIYSPTQTMMVQWKRSIRMLQKINSIKSIIFQKIFNNLVPRI